MTASHFDLVFEDFSRELDSIRTLLNSVGVGSASSAKGDIHLRISASNAAILLISAAFEQFVREILAEYVNGLRSRATGYDDLPKELGAAVWHRLTHFLRSSKFNSHEFDKASAKSMLTQLGAFCLDGDISIPIGGIVSYNQNNMKTKEINEVMRRAGIQDYCGAIGRTSGFVAFFGSTNPDNAHASFCAYLDEFYDARNEVAHSLGARRAAGASDVVRHVDFFELTARVIVADMNAK